MKHTGHENKNELVEPTLPTVEATSSEFRNVTLNRSATAQTNDQALWSKIRNATENIGFKNYKDFVDNIMCGDVKNTVDENDAKHTPFLGIDRYQLLKKSTELFLMTECGTYDELNVSNINEESKRYNRHITQTEIKDLWKEYQEPVKNNSNSESSSIETLPYLALIRRKLSDIPIKSSEEEFADQCYGILAEKLESPCFIELIWSYWHEEGLLAQAMNVISMRFQNKRISKNNDALAHLEVGPLRPMNNLLWGYIQDEPHRLNIIRRAYEYDHQYGLTLIGKAIPEMRTADSRSQFIEAFHNLLFISNAFYKEDADTTVIADGFKLLNAIKEVHIQLAYGAHNQYGDLPWNARIEMLMQQWLLSRPEMREFLPGRISIPYTEEWMPRIEALKQLQGWSDTSVSNFNYLAVIGEQLMLSIRYGNWSAITESDNAANWARYWRAEIQTYLHSYRVVTGADLSVSVDATLPSVYLRQRELANNKKKQA